MRLHEKVSFTLQTLTPLHIGSGEMFQPGLDYQIENGQFSLINRNRLFAELEDQDAGTADQITKAIDGKNLFNALRAKGFLDRVLSYQRPVRIEGAQPKEIRAQIRDGNGRPLLPGSSFKGALRTAIVAHLSRQPQHAQGLRNQLQTLRDSNKTDPKYADQGYLKQLLGKDPNHNLLRILSIPDLCFDRETLLPLAIKTIRLTGDGKHLADKGFNMGAEVIRAESNAVGNLVFDHYLQRDEIRSKLGFQAKLSATDLLAWIRQETAAAVDFELAFLADKTGDFVDDLRNFYLQLQQRHVNLNEKQAIFNLAWGTGWRGMTGAIVSEDELNARNYRLRSVLQLATKYAGSFPFPKSRRVALTPNGNVPMGWVLLSLCDEGVCRQTMAEINSQLDRDLELKGNERQQVLNTRSERERIESDERKQTVLREREKILQKQQAEEAAARRQAELDALSPVDRQLALLSSGELNENDVIALFASLPQLEEADKQKTASAIRDLWQRDPKKWSKKECSNKQWEKVQQLKKILGEV